jgi:hypothetical protein
MKGVNNDSKKMGRNSRKMSKPDRPDRLVDL